VTEIAKLLYADAQANGIASFFRQIKEVKGAIEISTPECQDLRICGTRSGFHQAPVI
jgi:hypothetical protein